MSDVFVSYAHKDYERAKPIVDALKLKGWKVFWDKDIPPGAGWDSFLESRLKQARCVLVLWSKNAVSSERVRHEASVARFRGVLAQAFLTPDVSILDIPEVFREIQLANLTGLADPTKADFTPLFTSVSMILSKRWGTARLRKLVIASVALLLVGWLSAVPIENWFVMESAGVEHIEWNKAHKYTTGENERLGEAIRDAKTIDLLMPNANSFTTAFRSDLIAFCAQGRPMRVIFASPYTDYYRENTRMTFRADLYDEKKKEAKESNEGLVARSREILMSDVNCGNHVQFKYFDTEFRVPLIITDAKVPGGPRCFVTIRLPPDQSPESVRLEFKGAGFAPSCVNHFERMWALAKDCPMNGPACKN